jgi:DNA polymerase elongation subunit (family B)
MPEIKEKVSNERIESFLQGTDPQEFIVAIEADYSTPIVTLVINDPETGKRLEEHKYKPFLWFKEDITSILYGGKRMKIIEQASFFGVKITKLKTSNANGVSPKRMENGYKFLATCTKSYNNLIKFFKDGGVDIFNKEFSSNFVMFSPTEQFLIQTGKRLFKGMDDYDDIHRFQFDLETTGLFPSTNSIFQIGVRDNRNMEYVLETLGETQIDKRNSEREIVEKFFQIIDIIKPDVITGYNSENFDWPFIFERAERLGMSVPDLAITLNRYSKIKRKPSKIKLGGDTESYTQTYMYGYSIIDISHAVRRAMAINSEIKGWGLKYITQYSGIAKPNRVYVAGDKINTTWADKVNDYAFNDKNGDWYIITEKKPLKEDYKVVKGDYIVQRYLCDDLWETEQIDNLFNQASFLISKILPTTFMRSSTMGTAGQWKLIMAAWSYENGLAIPETQPKRDFTGGLSRLLEVGFAKDVYKFDYAALYPKTQLTHDIFPDLDISGVMEGMLTYVVDTRDHFKFLTGIEKKKAKKLEAKIKADPKTMSAEEIQEINARVADMEPSELEEIKKQIAEHKRLSNLYDKKQLPLKILANSWFGSYGAPYIFNWGETDSAEETTCRGRQYLRLMIRVFTEKYGFRPLVMDTDGANLAAPSNLDTFKYLAKGSHWKTTEDAGKELTGFNAVLAEFNETYMEGRMGLDLDDVCNSTINFARKNYANDIGGKIKLVGNSVKSKKMSVYIEEFLAKGIRMLLDGDGHSFINFYYEYVDKVYNFQIPLVKIASKAKVKSSIQEYKLKATKKNKAGNPLPKQAHMELAIRDNLDVSLGDVLFYINTGTAKSHGDLKTIDKNKMTKKEREIYFKTNGFYPQPNKVVELNCKLIDPATVEHDFELVKELEMLKKALLTIEDGDPSIETIQARITDIDKELFTDEYNVARYLDAFNKKVKPLLVCFDPEIRNKILLDIVKVKDKENKTTIEKLKDRVIFTKEECELVSGMPFKETDQDSYDDLMRMEDKEIRFWTSVDKIPNNLEDESKWPEIVADYHERMRITRLEGIQNEKDRLDDILIRLELEDYRILTDEYILPVSIFTMADVIADDDGIALISRKWDVVLCRYEDLFKYEKQAKERDEYYKMVGNGNNDNVYEEWLNYIAEKELFSGNTITIDDSESTRTYMSDAIEVVNNFNKNLKNIEEAKQEKKKRIFSEGGDDDDDDGIEEDENGELIRNDEIIILDDEIDDTFPEVPEDYIISETKKVDDDDYEFPF